MHRLRRSLVAAASVLTALAALLLPNAPAASAGPTTYPWNIDTYDYGYGPGNHTFDFVNLFPWPWVDIVPAFANPRAFHVTADTCTAQVAPGAHCAVTVAYTPVNRPVADVLSLQFTDPSGNTVTSPGVRLFGGGAEYVTTDFLGNYITFQPIPVGQVIIIIIVLHLHGPGPIDLPPAVAAPFFMAGNTCSNVQPGAGSCQLSIGFRPTAPGAYTTSFQMSFSDQITGQPVDFPTVTLQATAR